MTESVSHLEVMQIENLGQRWSCLNTLQARPLLIRHLDLDLAHRLVDLRLLDDAAYAESFVRSRQRAGLASRSVSRELR